MTGILIVNVNNNCSTGSTALYPGAIHPGRPADCVWHSASRRCNRLLGGGADDRRVPAAPTYQGTGRTGRTGFPGGTVDVRGGRSRVHVDLRRQRRAFRQDRL